MLFLEFSRDGFTPRLAAQLTLLWHALHALAIALRAGRAADEWPFLISAILRFNTQIKPRNYPGFDYEWHLIDGERHSGTKAESWNRGLRSTFAPLAPK